MLWLLLWSSLLSYPTASIFNPTTPCVDDPQGIVANIPDKDCSNLGAKGTGTWSCDYFDHDFHGHAVYIWQLCPKSCRMCGKKHLPSPPEGSTSIAGGDNCANGVCYELGFWTSTAEEAVEYCFSVHSAITGYNCWPSIIQSGEMNMAAGVAAGAEAPWIGMRRRGADESKVEPGYTAWSPGEPNNAGGNEDCAVLVDRDMGPIWNDDVCHSERLPLCARWENLPAAVEVCGGGMCYIRGPEPALPMDAITECANMIGGWEASTITNEAQMVAAAAASEGTVTWLGMMKTDRGSGLNTMREEWMWLDNEGTPVGPFMPWLEDQPDNAEGGENCAQLIHGGWNDINCFVRSFPLCSRPESSEPVAIISKRLRGR